MVNIIDNSGVMIDLKTYLFNIESTIVIDDEITSSLANEIVYSLKCLETLDDAKQIIMMIKSPGGNIQAGKEIIQAMRLCQKEIVTVAFGDVQSMAANIFFAGSKRIMYPSATLLIHNPIYCSPGKENLEYDDISYLLNASEVEKASILNHLMLIDGLKLSREELSDFMDEEKCFTAKEAIQYGLAHKIATRL